MTFSYQKILTLKYMYSVKTKQNKLLALFSLFSNQMNQNFYYGLNRKIEKNEYVIVSPLSVTQFVQEFSQTIGNNNLRF